MVRDANRKEGRECIPAADRPSGSANGSSVWISLVDYPLRFTRLQVEVDLGPERYYHSIFTCPVLKEQCTTENPPVRLPCGHCLSMESVKRLTKPQRAYSYSSQSQIKYVKCPYCPSEQPASEFMRVFF
eukprot:m.407161 g.407161  ORF g.407161 m.407161 type:complete len:129 (-) comp56505_c0_seq7:106-492(-)